MDYVMHSLIDRTEIITNGLKMLMLVYEAIVLNGYWSTLKPTNACKNVKIINTEICAYTSKYEDDR